MKSQGASSPPAPGARSSGSLLTSWQWLCPRRVPLLPGGPGRGAAWGQTTTSQRSIPLRPIPASRRRPPALGSSGEGSISPASPSAATVPAERSEPGGYGVGDGARTPAPVHKEGGC